MNIPIEDEFHDILGKAMNGLRLSEAEVSRKSGVSVEIVRNLARGALDETSLPRLAQALGLEPNALARVALNLYRPRPVELEGLEIFNTPYHSGMRVNAFLVWDPTTRACGIFDTGTDAFPILDAIEERGLTPQGLFLTHTHPDHIAEVDSLKRRLEVPVHCNEREPFHGAERFSEGDRFALGNLTVEPRTTWGHSRGGTTYVISGLEHPVAIVGDALFAGSMGGGMVSYADALRTNREKIFTLPDETIVCPGHGPMTTVREEKRNNPFFASEFSG